MENSMFCYQCQETAQGTGCVRVGVCGKSAETAHIQDLLLYVTKGVCVTAHTLRQHGQPVANEVNRYVTDALFSTITNANFSNTSLLFKVKSGVELKRRLLDAAQAHHIDVPQTDAVEWDGTADSPAAPPHYNVGVLSEPDPELRALKELVLYGLKGMAAYMHHAMRLGFDEADLHAFLQKTMAEMATKHLTGGELTTLVLETGAHGVRAMALLDKAHNAIFGHPEMSHVRQDVGDRPGILISGHDLRDLENLLEQTEGTGIDIYTHGEMLPAHAYPAFKKYKHLRGHYGGSWWRQREEFEAFNGPILLTTNCLVPPVERNTYADRLYTSGPAGYPDCEHIEEDSFGEKDFSALITQARHCPPPMPLGYKGTLTIGFGHTQLQKAMPQLTEAIRQGTVSKLVVMAGCDGRRAMRHYYTDFAKAIPADAVIITAGCAKFRYNQLNLGKIAGIPRLIDCGQCNDSYSIVQAGLMLRDALGAKSLNDLPVVYNLAWYEQKAVIVFLALLSLKIKNIRLGPTLPAFLTPAMRQLLATRFGLSTIVDVDMDIHTLFAKPELVEEIDAPIN